MAGASTNSSSAVPGSRSTTLLPPVDTIPNISDFQSLSGSSVGSLSRQPSLRSRAVDDGAISNQTIVYPGDTRVITPSRSSSLRRTTSMTDLVKNSNPLYDGPKTRDLDWVLVWHLQVPS